MRSILRKIKKLLSFITLSNIKCGLGYIKRNGLKGFFGRGIAVLHRDPGSADPYKTWIVNNEPTEKELKLQREYVSCQNLLFDVIAKPSKELSDSLAGQTYRNFKFIPEKENAEELIAASNSDYILFVGENVTLSPSALYFLAVAIEYRDSIMLFSDNDKMIDGERSRPDFKPGFARDTILSENYIGGFLCVETKFLKTHPSLTEELNNNFIYDIALRVSEKTRKIEHIEKILFHETLPEMPIVREDDIAVIKAHLDRMGVKYDSVSDGKFKGQYHIKYTLLSRPLISLVVPNKDHTEDLKKLIASLERSTYKNYELIIVENNSEKETFLFYDEIKKADKRIRVVTADIGYFNYSAIVNCGVEHSKGKYVVLLNNDIEFITADWMEEMIGYCQRSDVGICGAELFFPDRSIQHAGVTIGTRGLAGHRSRLVKESDFTADDYISTVQDLSAVTAACFMVERQLYIDMLGFDEKLAVAFNDVDFCMKIRGIKKLIVYDPFVEAYHYESKSRGEDTVSEEKQKRFAKEYELFVKRWTSVIKKGDPYYNKNLRLDTDLREINYNRIN